MLAPASARGGSSNRTRVSLPVASSKTSTSPVEAFSEAAAKTIDPLTTTPSETASGSERGSVWSARGADFRATWTLFSPYNVGSVVIQFGIVVVVLLMLNRRLANAVSERPPLAPGD